MSSRGLATCPACGERLQSDWVRPVLLALAVVIGVVVGLVAGPGLRRAWERADPAALFSSARAAIARVRIPISVPSVTPSPTPSITPTPTRTPTATPTPSLTPLPTETATPTPSLTPTLTSTPTASPTRARSAQTSKLPTSTATPAPSLAAPTLAAPANGTTFHGASAVIWLSWKSTNGLGPDDLFQLTLRYARAGTDVQMPAYTQDTSFRINADLYLQSDQETNRAYWWSVQIVRKTIGPEGTSVYIPLSPAAEEWVLYWW